MLAIFPSCTPYSHHPLMRLLPPDMLLGVESSRKTARIDFFGVLARHSLSSSRSKSCDITSAIKTPKRWKKILENV